MKYLNPWSCSKYQRNREGSSINIDNIRVLVIFVQKFVLPSCKLLCLCERLCRRLRSSPIHGESFPFLFNTRYGNVSVPFQKLIFQTIWHAPPRVTFKQGHSCRPEALSPAGLGAAVSLRHANIS